MYMWREAVMSRKVQVSTFERPLLQWISHLLSDQVTRFQFVLTTVVVRSWLTKKKLPGFSQPQEKMGIRVNALRRKRNDSTICGVCADGLTVCSEAGSQLIASPLTCGDMG